jgi:hypothetical protein
MLATLKGIPVAFGELEPLHQPAVFTKDLLLMRNAANQTGRSAAG